MDFWDDRGTLPTLGPSYPEKSIDKERHHPLGSPRDNIVPSLEHCVWICAWSNPAMKVAIGVGSNPGP
jgi:hypothetical protein